MAVAPFITPLELGMRPGKYNYTKGGVTIEVEAFAIFFDEEGRYNEYNINTNSILSWYISPNEFYYLDEENGFAKVPINNILVFDINGDPIDFGAAYPASRVSKITIQVLENKSINAKRYNLSTSLFDLTVAYLPDYLKGRNNIDNQVTKKIFNTSPLKLFSNEYLLIKDQPQLVNNILIPDVLKYITKGTFESENVKLEYAGSLIPNTFHLTYNTLGKKDVLVNLQFTKDFLIRSLDLNFFDTFDVQEKYEDYLSNETLRFVNDFSKANTIPPYIAPNEFVVEDNINAVFKKIDQQLKTYLQERKIINPMLTKRLGWYNTPDENWHYYINNINGSFEFFEPQENVTPLNDIFVTDNEIFYIKDNKIHEITKNYSTVATFRIGGYNESAPFLNVKNILLDSKKKLFVFDAGAARLGIFKRNFTRTTSLWVNQVYFGGIGGRNAKNKFLLPNSIFFDNEENVYVVDTGNGVLKKYSNDGVWLKTIKSNLFDNTLIHGATDREGDYHILKPSTVAKISKNGESLLEYKLFNPDSIPIKIVTDPLKDFLFVIYRNKIQKYYKSGKYVATIYGTENVGIENSDYFLPCQDLYNFYWSWDALSCAQNLDLNPVEVAWKDTAAGAIYSKTWGNQTTRIGSSQNNNLDFNIYSACIDQTRNLYIAIGGYLQKFLSNTNFLYLGDDLNTEYYWNLNEILIQKEEIVQDWVYNRSFQRMWDNIELVRKCVVKKMNVNSGSYQTRYFSKKDFNLFTWFDKNSIVFGQNEIVTTDVVNRNVEKLWKNVLTIRDMLNYRDLLTEVTTLTAGVSDTGIIDNVNQENTQEDIDQGDNTVNAAAYFRLGFSTTEKYPEFIIKLTKPELIQRARRMIVGQETVLSIKGSIVPQKTPYNPNYDYYLDPDSIEFFELAPEICNIDPVYINTNLAIWMETRKGEWCPWSSYLEAELTLSVNMET